MNSGKKQFLLGALVASLLVAMVMDGGALLAAVNQALALNQMPSEIRLGYDLELLPHKAFTVDLWKEEIPSGEFRMAVQKTLQLLNAPVAERLSLMVKAGILPLKQNKLIVSRREAFETIFRALAYLWNVGLLPAPSSVSGRKRFADYCPSKKFRPAMAYLLEHKILQGFPDGRLRVGRPLTNRDCIYLLSRLYEHVNSTHPAVPADSRPTLVDISMEQWLTEPIKRLDEAGAFAFIRLGQPIEGDRPLPLADTAGMVSGILAHQDRAAQLASIQEIVGEAPTVRRTTRGQLARLSAVLVGAFQPSSTVIDFPYVDVLPDSPEGQSLRCLAGLGVKMGYPTGRFAADESVTRYEVIGTINAVLRLLMPTGATLPTPGQASPEGASRVIDATTSTPPGDFEQFVGLIKAKQEKIREIMNWNKRKPHERSD